MVKHKQRTEADEHASLNGHFMHWNTTFVDLAKGSGKRSHWVWEGKCVVCGRWARVDTAHKSTIGMGTAMDKRCR